MKRDNQNRISANKIRQSKDRQLLTGVSAKRNQAIAGAIIFVVIVLHFVSQFVFFPRENFQNQITSAKTGVQENAKIKTAAGTKNSDTGATPIPAAPITQQMPKTPATPRAVIKKKEPARQSRAERLRRAEKILTGV